MGKNIEEMSLQELQNRARKLGVVGASLMKKEKLRLAIIDVEANPDRELVVEGLLERLPDGFGFFAFSAF